MAVVPCTPSVPVTGFVTFDPATFRAAYPEFKGISDAVLNQNFAIASLLLNNSCGSRVSDANQRDTLLNILVAHLTLLSSGTNDGSGNITGAPGVIGRVNSATEGAVNISVELNAAPNSSLAYLSQTKYGLLYWTLTAKYRTFVYIPPIDGCELGYGWPSAGWNGGRGC